jgi:hypothetical protein
MEVDGVKKDSYLEKKINGRIRSLQVLQEKNILSI